MTWHLLFLGEHGTRTEGDCVHLEGHTSSVSVIVDEEKNILIDTGARHRFEDVRSGLKKIGIQWEEITDVILTHFHLDHAGNVARLPDHVNLFAWQHNWKYGDTIRLPTLHAFALTSHVKIYNTPGHTPEHNSVLYECDEGKVIFAGDAINEHYFKTHEVKSLNFDNELYKKSANWIIKNADIIVPGHGQIL